MRSRANRIHRFRCDFQAQIGTCTVRGADWLRHATRLISTSLVSTGLVSIGLVSTRLISIGLIPASLI